MAKKKKELTELDMIVKQCKERGISYGQFQTEETWKKLRKEEKKRKQKIGKEKK